MNLERILVVDNDERWRNLYKRTLETEGYTVTLANDYETALEELKRSFYPMVVVDLRLLGDTDSEGLRLIQEMDSLWPPDTIHKIIVSGWPLSASETQQITQTTESQFVSFLSKGGEDGTGFDHLRLKSTVSLGFARLRRPVRCLLHPDEECQKPAEPKLDQVFVAMPYTLEVSGITINMDELYADGIEKPLGKIGYKALRADKNPLVGALMCNICSGIQESAICIADITEWNPNVLFELGLMYGLGKTVIIVKRKGSKVPTDLRFALYVEYDGYRSLGSKLKGLIRNLQRGQST